MTEPFVVAIKDSAIERNEAVRSHCEEGDQRVRFESPDAAREWAAELSEGASDVRIQAVAPQDDAEVDAYLVGASRSDATVPDADPEEGWRFGVDAAQYGALGEALLTAGDGVATPLECYVRRDLEVGPDADLSVDVEDEPRPVTAPGIRGEWQPDCLIEAAIGGRRVATYRCEVKTGDGSLERNQRAVVEATADETPVLLVRVDVSALPREYEVSFERIGAESEQTAGAPAQLTFEDLE